MYHGLSKAEVKESPRPGTRVATTEEKSNWKEKALEVLQKDASFLLVNHGSLAQQMDSTMNLYSGFMEATLNLKRRSSKRRPLPFKKSSECIRLDEHEEEK